MRMPTEKEKKKAMLAIDGRRKIVEAAVQQVVQGYSSALFVYGPAGLGKSHVLCALLDALCPGSWKHHTAYSTAKALMLSLAEAPGSVHLFEDCERMLKTDLSASLLRAACGAPGDRERWVTYETANERFKVNVTGGIIIATNENLSRKTGPMQGVASRFRPILWNLSIDERIAVIASIADHPWQRGKTCLPAREVKQVAQATVELVEQADSGVDLDLRLFTEHALPAYAHAKQTGVGNWKDVLLAKLSGLAQTDTERQNERTERLRTLAEMIAKGGGTLKQKMNDWKAKTGLGQAIYYRHLRESKRRGKL